MGQLIVNGQIVETNPGMTILAAARQAGITIPTLCDHPDLSPYGGCRLCVVEVVGERRPAASCTLEAADGMIVRTESPLLRKERRKILELLLSLYYDKQVSLADENNELLRWARFYKVAIKKGMANEARYPIDSDPNPFIYVDLNKCIMCTRCVRACAEVQGRFVWGVLSRGIETKIAAGLDEPLLEFAL